jgi:hypothetical protein
MKLKRLDSTTQYRSPESVERARRSSAVEVRRVESAEGLDGERQRSLQQEVADFPANIPDHFEGGQRILLDVQALAAELVARGADSHSLIKLASAASSFYQLDDKV